MAAWDYPAAIHAIESIPEPLRNPAATSLIRECQQKKDESESLIATITERIQRKEIDGLVPIVSRAVSLRGDRKDLAKIHGQLLERRDARLSKARTALAAGDAAAAAKALTGAAMDDLGEEVVLLDRVARAHAAEAQLLGAVKEAKADGEVSADEAQRILQAAEACLVANPASGKASLLVGQAREIIQRDARRREAEEQRRRTLQQQLMVKTLALPPLRNSIGIQLKLLPAGSFTMGEGEDAHRVTLKKPFFLGVTEVTNAQWKRVMGSVPSNWKDDDRPVEQVSWDDAVEFCKKLSALPEERKAGRVYRLPTEAEWEYACRAGTSTRYSFADDKSRLGTYGWFDGNSRDQTQPVGKKKFNAWGLFDMHGNVWEWCSDWFDKYPQGAVTDPQGPSGASGRVYRGGGGWDVAARFCRSAYRRGGDSSIRHHDLGFRLALSPPGAEPTEADK